jgi:hypothetical protein
MKKKIAPGLGYDRATGEAYDLNDRSSVFVWLPPDTPENETRETLMQMFRDWESGKLRGIPEDDGTGKPGIRKYER